MSVKKIILTSLVAMSMSSISMMAYAKLSIMNNTDKDSTSILNDGMCSSMLPGGVTKAHSPNEVDDKIIAMGCLMHETNCKADVYMTNNCTGNKVATVFFDTKKGIKIPVEEHNKQHYSISVKGAFNIEINQPVLASK